LSIGITAAITAASAPFLSAAAPVIGMAMSQNGVTVDNSKISGTATLFDGANVQADGYSRLHLNNGTRLDLGAGSKAQVFANHAALRSGMSEMQSSTGFEIDTPNLRIQSGDGNSIARVRIENDKVFVTAVNAPVNVMNGRGMLVAKVAPGMPLSFMQGAAASNAFDVTDCVLQKNGAAILDDQKGNQVFELRGADLRKGIGSVLRVVGTADASAAPAAGATMVIKVTSATIVKKGGCTTQATTLGASTAAAGLGAAAASGAGVAAGGAAAAGAGAAAASAGAAAAGIGTTAAVVGGVAAATAAAVGGAAAAGAFATPSP
jgi:hypothetical protein